MASWVLLQQNATFKCCAGAENRRPFLGTTSWQSNRGVIARTELLVALELCFPGEKYMEKAESRREAEELAGGGEAKSLS